jgi:hypothetical protein
MIPRKGVAAQGPHFKNVSVNILNKKQKCLGNFILIHRLETTKGSCKNHYVRKTFIRVRWALFLKE